ncbi:hypothetical protein [Sphingobium ummariense]|uniref:DUF4136 domain-containing protein n=1 Tax=Sphingobium ummariense RL-3 TaxID=1346791 RepID=T0J830_9SPHN|nr:hypothetical protein [Sphingobium ummariense]EQB34111.1 hypothetical protein M529_00410 [Sphingobium ummariense RL-3]
MRYDAILPSVVKGFGSLIASLILVGTLFMPAASLAAPPPVEGTLSVEASRAGGGQDASSDQFRDAAASALSAKGFTLLDGADHAAYRMELLFSVSEVGTGSARATAGSANATSGGVAGAVGSVVKVPLPSRKTHAVALEKTQLEMRLRKRGEEEVIWRGTAVTVRPADTQGSTAADLCNALIRAYPFQSDDVIGVP